MELSSERLQKIQHVIENYLESFSQTLNTITNTDIKFTLNKCGEVTGEELNSIFEGEVVRVLITPLEGIEGNFTFIWTSEFTAKIADLMLAGDGTAPFNAEEHLEPAQEISSQLIGPIVAHLTSNLGTKVELNAPEVKLVEIGELLEELTPQVTTVIDGSIGDSNYTWTFSMSEAQAEVLEGIALTEEEEDNKVEDDVVAERVEFEPFPDVATKIEGNEANINLLMDLKLQVSIELGRTRLFVKNILELGQGSVIELNKLSGDPVDIYVNERKFAEGEVVVVDENFGVRITELISPSERVKNLGD